MTLTQARLKEVLHYEAETGVFTWKMAPPRKPFLLGKTAGFDVNGYVGICVDRKKYPAHHLAWLYVTGVWPVDEIDHRNLVRDDNRFVNLRPASHQQNMRNQPLRSNSTSRVTGISWHRGAGKWRAHITVDARFVHLGFFVDKAEATAVRQAAEVRLFGEFAPEARA